MKTIKINLEDEFHKQLKLAAINADMTLQAYLLEAVQKEANPLSVSTKEDVSESPGPIQVPKKNSADAPVVPPDILEEFRSDFKESLHREADFERKGTAKCGHPELRDGKCSTPKCKNSVYA